jgi:RNA polymerase sigma-70 factor (ECF subfamily)
MKRINLRDYYPFYTSDCFIEVPDEVVAMLHDFELREAAYRLRTYRHKAYYSLDRDEGAEHDLLFVELLPDEIYERKVTAEQLHLAIASLSDKQAKRIYAHYFLGMSKAAIARAEGVSRATVGQAITRGLRSMELYLKKHFG